MVADMKSYMAKRRSERRARLIKMSGGACEICGSEESLEFNHIDRSTKSFGLDKRGMDYKWSTILEEWRKCELLCNLHHKEKTKEQYDNGEMPEPWNQMRRMPYIHGTMRMYHETACRCDLCRMAKHLYRNKKITYSEKI